MTDLRPLIRLHRQRVEERQRKLNDLLGLRDQLQDRVTALDSALAAEQAVADGLPDAALHLVAFARETQRRRSRVEQSIADAERWIAAAEVEIAEAFQELKRYELAHEDRCRREAEARRRQETALFDETALVLHRRRTSGEA